jgi:hypothetical protein
MEHNDEFRRPVWRATPGMMPAIILIAVGVLFLLSTLHVDHLQEWYRYWPVLLIAAGLAKLVDSDTHGARILGAILAGGGGLLLADNLYIIQLTWAVFWPLVLIGLGLLMLWNRLSGSRSWMAPPTARFGDDNVFYGNVIFSGFKRRITDGDFRGAYITAIFGGGELNLRQASMSGDSAVVTVSAIFGGIELKVPRNWLVVSQGTGIFGGFSDSTDQPPEDTPGLKRLIVRGEAVFGGVDIKN